MDFNLPLIISGPCAAESRKQMLKTAEGLAALNCVSVFRSGIWKPRTRPGSFEGIGSKGFIWLNEVKARFGFLTAVEVANARHVEEALGNGVDVLWVGARTTVNPFSVQEIADALKGVKVPVMVKNPVHPDLLAWVGALERISQAGIRQLIAVHRGFYTGETGTCRNAPHWEIPAELKTLFPSLTIICDPSHICGNRELLEEISRKALDLNFDGLMIESHFDPENALVDKNQQVKPEYLGKILKRLNIKAESLKSNV